jgi:hypothetical protein
VPLKPGDFVAGYAAAVATASLGWQVWNSYRAKRPHVTVLLDSWRSSQDGATQTVEEADIRIRNREDYAVQVDRLYFRNAGPGFLGGRSIPADISAGQESELPFDVPARDVVSLRFAHAKPSHGALLEPMAPRLPRKSVWSCERVSAIGVGLLSNRR